jgi:hypothetical protein
MVASPALAKVSGDQVEEKNLSSPNANSNSSAQPTQGARRGWGWEHG